MSIVEQMEGIRLYSSSLLIVYDAATVEAEDLFLFRQNTRWKKTDKE